MQLIMDNGIFEKINHKMNNLCTSTPNDSKRINKQISRPSSNIFRNLISQFSQNNNNMSYRRAENDNCKYMMGEPCYADFIRGTPKVHENYVDSHESLRIQLMTIKPPTSSSIESAYNSVIGYLENCSISKIEGSHSKNIKVHPESSVVDIGTTLVPDSNSENCMMKMLLENFVEYCLNLLKEILITLRIHASTLPLNRQKSNHQYFENAYPGYLQTSSKISNKSKNSGIERRHSSAVHPFHFKVKNESNNESKKHPQSTIIHPFSFEIREKAKQELKQERLQYEIAAEQLNAAATKIKLNAECKASPVLADAKKIIEKGIITKPVLPLKPCEMQCNVIRVSNSNDRLKSTIRLKQTKVAIKTGDQNKVLENNVPLIYPKKDEIKDMKANIRPKLQKLAPWKRKPFQVSLPQRQLTIAHSPKLKTAERADSWKLYEKRRLEREKHDQAERNARLVIEYQRQKEEIAKIRKQTVHKSIPIPRAILKRPQVDPLNQFVKRVRRN